MRSFFSTTVGKIVGVAGALIIAALAAHWATSQTPNESNRIRHRAGYSVIHPDGWSPDLRHGAGLAAPGIPPTRDLIVFSPDHYVGVAPTLFIKRLSGPDDPAILKSKGWQDGTFQGQPALVLSQTQKHSVIRAAIFTRAEQCFEAVEMLPFAAQVHDAEYWAFLETFRYPDGPIDPLLNLPIPTTRAATQPGDDASTKPIEF